MSECKHDIEQETTDELNNIPGFRGMAWKKYNSLVKEGKIIVFKDLNKLSDKAMIKFKAELQEEKNDLYKKGRCKKDFAGLLQ